MVIEKIPRCMRKIQTEKQWVSTYWNNFRAFCFVHSLLFSLFCNRVCVLCFVAVFLFLVTVFASLVVDFHGTHPDSHLFGEKEKEQEACRKMSSYFLFVLSIFTAFSRPSSITTCSYMQLLAATCSYLRLLAATCSYLQVFAGVCRYLQLFAAVCSYLQEFAAVCGCLQLRAPARAHHNIILIISMMNGYSFLNLKMCKHIVAWSCTITTSGLQRAAMRSHSTLN